MRVEIEPGTRRVNPNSVAKRPGDVLDGSIPVGMAVCCDKEGFIHLLPLVAEVLGKEVWVSVKLLQKGEKCKIVPGGHKKKVLWNEKWAFIFCPSRAAADYVIDRLSDGDKNCIATTGSKINSV